MNNVKASIIDIIFSRSKGISQSVYEAIMDFTSKAIVVSNSYISMYK